MKAEDTTCKCGEEIGNHIFTVCDSCWDKHFRVDKFVEIKTITYTEKDFKEMVNGWNEEINRLEFENKELKKENEKLREIGGNIFLEGLLKRILKGQHEIVDATNMLRSEVIYKSHIIKVFEDLAISEEEINF
jgi:anti-sigma-K factor RskA